MEFNTFDTFNGKLVMGLGADPNAQLCELSKADCIQCEILQSRVQFLEEKVALLEDIVLTSDVISEINRTLLLNQSSDKTVSHQYSEVGVQTDCQPCSSVQFDGVHNIPESFMLVDSKGQIEAPDSLLFLNVEQQTRDSEDSDSINPWDPNFYHKLNCSPVSSIDTNEYDSISSIRSPERSAASEHDGSPIPESVKSIEFIDTCPFNKFSADKLVKELNFSHKFSNRMALYFGKHPYRYNGGTHEPKDIPSGSYLDRICCYLEVILPNVEYNSVLINLYKNGEDSMPSHSDSECCIQDSSEIVTVSLGATRKMKITESTTGNAVQSVHLDHGSLSIMSKTSQSYFRHEIPSDLECTELRVSLTFRLIKPDTPNRNVKRIDNHHLPDPYAIDPKVSGYVPYPKDLSPQKQLSQGATSSNEQPSSQVMPPNAPSSALYISSSMFRHVDEKKLSSPKIKASKLFYPGADAAVMLNKLKGDLPTLHLNPSTIYLMCGTNNVNSVYFGSRSLKEAVTDITELLNYLKHMFPSAKIHIINVLPRLTKGRNDVVTELNKLLRDFCLNNSFNFMETTHLYNLRNGKRKNMFFMASDNKIEDNCHLNSIGVIRLGKYLKFWSHKHLELNSSRSV